MNKLALSFVMALSIATFCLIVGFIVIKLFTFLMVSFGVTVAVVSLLFLGAVVELTFLFAGDYL